MNEHEIPGDPVSGHELHNRIRQAIDLPNQEEHMRVSSDGADLTVPRSQEEKIRELLDRLQGMTNGYALHLDKPDDDYFRSLAFLNEHFFLDRPVSIEEIREKTSSNSRTRVRHYAVKVLKNLLSIIFERQRNFNAETVKTINRITETFGHQRDFNMDVIKFCERMIDHYRLMEDTERRLDDFFTAIVRIGVLEDDIEDIRRRLKNLEQKFP